MSLFAQRSVIKPADIFYNIKLTIRVMNPLFRNQMLLILTVVMALVPFGMSYTLEGQWKLTKQQLNYIKQDPNVRFSFVNYQVIPAMFPPQDILDGPSINSINKSTKQLTVYACRTLTYNYYVNENNMYLQQVSSSGVNRPCLPNQITELEAKLNSTFFFSIQNDALILYDPQSHDSLHLIRQDQSVLNISPNTYQQWTIRTLGGSTFDSSNEKSVIIGNNTIDLCNFKGSLNFNQTQRNNLATILKQDNCFDKNIAGTFKNISFYIVSGRNMLLFNKSLDQIGSLSFDRRFNQDSYNSLKNSFATINNVNNTKDILEQNQSIINNTVTNKTQTIIVNVTNTTKTQTGGETAPKTPTGTLTNTTETSTKTQTGGETTPKTPTGTLTNTTETSTKTQIGGETTPKTPSSTSQLTTQPLTNSSNSNQNSAPQLSFFIPYQTYNSSCHCNSIKGLDSLNPFTQSQLYNKWYLYAINGTDYKIEKYYYYFMIITAGRMIYYGGCEVKWSPFTLVNNTLSNLNTRALGKSSCIKPNLDEHVLDPFYNEVNYVNFQQNQGIPYIVFYNENLNHIATFHTQKPIYPPDNIF